MQLVPASVQLLRTQQGPPCFPHGLQSPVALAPMLSQIRSKLEQPPVPGRPSQHRSPALPQGQRPFWHWP